MLCFSGSGLVPIINSTTRSQSSPHLNTSSFPLDLSEPFYFKRAIIEGLIGISEVCIRMILVCCSLPKFDGTSDGCCTRDSNLRFIHQGRLSLGIPLLIGWRGTEPLGSWS